MPIHVLIPFADSFEGLVLPTAVHMIAVHLIVFVAGRRAGPSYGALDSVKFGVGQCWYVLVIRHGNL